MSVNSKMKAIADAIRAKTGGTAALTLDGMAEAVAGIQAGGGDYPDISGVEFPAFVCPPIPSGIADANPYCIVYRNDAEGYYELACNSSSWRCTGSAGDKVQSTGSKAVTFYRIGIDAIKTATEWTYRTQTTNYSIGIDDNEVVWTSHDIIKYGTEVWMHACGDLTQFEAHAVETDAVTRIADALRVAYEPGVYTVDSIADAIQAMGQLKSAACGTVTPATQGPCEIEHGLGKIPDFIVVVGVFSSFTYSTNNGLFAWGKLDGAGSGYQSGKGMFEVHSNGTAGQYASNVAKSLNGESTTSGFCDKGATTTHFTCGGSKYFMHAGATYNWLAGCY